MDEEGTAGSISGEVGGESFNEDPWKTEAGWVRVEDNRLVNGGADAESWNIGMKQAVSKMGR